jgi:Fic family protein
MTLVRFRDVLDAILPAAVGPAPKISTRRLIAHARRAKSYDAYHNTTLEGYRISREMSDAVVNGDPLPDAITEQERRAIMAVQGYSHAFDRVLTLAQESPRRPVDAALILELYAALFRPSVDAGLVSIDDLRGWRTGPVGLAGGWRHVPPNAKKIPDLIAGLADFLSDDRSSVLTHTVLAHLEFVTIHPFLDGNGRLGRLLMNYVLLGAGYPWVTIRSDERTPYFSALERAQVEEDVTELAHFLAHHMVAAVDEVRPRVPSTRRRR